MVSKATTTSELYLSVHRQATGEDRQSLAWSMIASGSIGRADATVNAVAPLAAACAPCITLSTGMLAAQGYQIRCGGQGQPCHDSTRTCDMGVATIGC